MKVTVEISMYPLTEAYAKHVDRFIRSLYTYDLEVRTSYTSTHVIGEYEEVMSALTQEMKTSFSHGKASFVMKVLGGDLSKEVDLDGYR